MTVPWERLVLIAFAAGGVVWTVSFALLANYSLTRAEFPSLVRIPIVLILSIFMSLIWSDGVAHAGKGWVLGYPYNPYVMAIGEFEGWMGPVLAGDVPQWRAVMCGPPPVETPWWGQPSVASPTAARVLALKRQGKTPEAIVAALASDRDAPVQLSVDDVRKAGGFCQ